MQIGKKIKKLRVANDLTQEELAGRCELSKGFISQIERDLTSPSIASLVDILDALGSNLNEFFSEKEEEQIVFSQKDYFILENTNLKLRTKWIIPNAQKNTMEPILIEIDPGGRTKLDDPHEGEEFGYLISGNIKLYLGNRVYKVKKGESFYYSSREVHGLENIGKSKARVLWISNPPSF